MTNEPNPRPQAPGLSPQKKRRLERQADRFGSRDAIHWEQESAQGLDDIALLEMATQALDARACQAALDELSARHGSLLAARLLTERDDRGSALAQERFGDFMGSPRADLLWSAAREASPLTASPLQPKRSSPARPWQGRERRPLSGAAMQTQLGPGQRLDPELRRQLEALLGISLEDVRLHSLEVGFELTREVNAKAFAMGKDVVFGEGEYQPDTLEGRRLIAHEVAHVAQQKSGIATSSDEWGVLEDPALEAAADQAAARLETAENRPFPEEKTLSALSSSGLRGGEQAVVQTPSAPSPVIQRAAQPNAKAPADSEGDDDGLETLQALYKRMKVSRDAVKTDSGRLNKLFRALSEEDLKTIKRNPAGRSRWKVVGGEEVPDSPGEVTQEEWEAADKRLNEIDASKGPVDDALTAAVKAKLDQLEEIKKHLSEAKALNDAYREKAAALKSAPKADKARLHQELSTLEAKLNSAQTEATKGLAKLQTSDGRSKPVIDMDAVKELAGQLADAGRANSERSQARKAYAASGSDADMERVRKADERSRSALNRLKGTVNEKTAKGSLFNAGAKIDVSLFKVEAVDQDLGSGFKRNASASVLSAEATGNVNAGWGPDGASVTASGSASAKLVDFNEEIAWESPPVTIFGETLIFKTFIKMSGMIGIEAKAALEAKAKTGSKSGVMKADGAGAPKLDHDELMKGTGMKLDPQTGKATARPELGASASAEAFAGAKLSVGVGAAVEWQKKAHSEYAEKLDHAADVILDVITFIAPPIGWILRALGAKSACKWILEKLFEFGTPGTVPIVAIEAMLEASVGVGGRLSAVAKMEGGKISVQFKANATWGVGVGADISFMINLLDGIKFGLIILGELRQAIIDWAVDKIKSLANAVVAFFNDVADFFSRIGQAIASIFNGLEDDKAREGIANGAHKLLDPATRGKWLYDMLGGPTGQADELSIIELLRDARERGDMEAVLAETTRRNGGDSARDWILSDVQGANYPVVCAILDHKPVDVGMQAKWLNSLLWGATLEDDERGVVRILEQVQTAGKIKELLEAAKADSGYDAAPWIRSDLAGENYEKANRILSAAGF